MRWPRRSPRRAVQQLVPALLVFVSVLWLVLPPDHTFVLWLRFTTLHILSALPTVRGQDDWVFQHALFPVDLDRDATFILKTGYGTRDRISAQIKALDLRRLAGFEGAVMVVGDFSAHRRTEEGLDFGVRDMLNETMAHDSLSSMQDAHRLVVYRDMTGIIANSSKAASELSRKHGWELDAMKFIPALEAAWKTLPRKKWYLMLDDDTYIIRPSLQLLLGHLDPSKPTYLGNAVGDFKSRFAHGGSGFVVSEAAMRRLFDEHPAVVRGAYVASLTETWGDRLVALTFAKVGVYLDERYARFFNGERPALSRIRADRFCTPVVSFHGLTVPGQMAAVGDTFRGVDGPVSWSQLWKIYGRRPGLEDFAKEPIRRGVDHVGPMDEHTTAREGVASADDCLAFCLWSRNCLAWTWEQSTGSCHLAPWLIMGDKPESRQKENDLFSGVHPGRARALQQRCDQRSA